MKSTKYDKDGNVEFARIYQYDSNGQLVKIYYINGSGVIAYAYYYRYTDDGVKQYKFVGYDDEGNVSSEGDWKTW